MRTVSRMRAAIGTLLLLSSTLFACPGSQSPVARAQEAANELNLNTRFGRMELASERVEPAAREAFLTRRRAWGANVRVADYEFAGLKMKGDRDAEMLVKVAWYRIDQGDLRTTLLKQKWHDFKGDWRLTEESRAEGDLGLMGESAPPAEPAKGTQRNAQFPTIRLGQESEGAAPTDNAAERPSSSNRGSSPEPSMPTAQP